ncbi:hypothetical protein [Janthinobacterium aquaticum]|uniref:hypothetical protein n=1 Tax=Janthinobacterium sp. FT58W TaxID=2654254 RepID=UPI001263F7E8|nr:hypothetical protein [Janthinobacterium sp. FT58W]KAB8041230.1 hypothetical protein GCM43_19540 [Janthinobacterium sp. FT58W]
MHSEFIERQIALVSYGTQFLRNGLALEDWYRHGIFFGARLQFRQLAGNALLADDFTWWLGVLQQTGAVRLSLHRLAQFGIDSPSVLQYRERAVVVHFRDRYQIWAVGEERAAWLEHPQLPPMSQMPRFPDATSWGGDIDSYWCVDERPGQLEIPETDWKALARTIATDLDINLPSSRVPAGPLFLPVSSPAPWARFPLFVSGPASSLAHGVLATLYSQYGTYDNDMNPKNENSDYRMADEAGAQRIEDWGRRLEAWIGEVQLRCANEMRQKMEPGKYGLAAREMPAEPEPARPAAPDTNRAAISHVEAASEQASPSKGKWLRRIAFVVVLAMMCVLLLAGAHLLVDWPWLAVVPALPWVLHRFRKDS